MKYKFGSILVILWFFSQALEAAAGRIDRIENVEDHNQGLTSNPAGLVAGGVVGGALGGVITDNFWGGLIGAGVGALAGSVVENQIRRPQLKKYTITLATGENVVVFKNPDEQEQFRKNQIVYVYKDDFGKLYAFSRPYFVQDNSSNHQKRRKRRR